MASTYLLLLLFVGVLGILILRPYATPPSALSPDKDASPASPLAGVDRISVEESIRPIDSNQIAYDQNASAENVVPAYLAIAPAGSLDAAYC